MPTYKITDPTTGKIVKLTGDSPPTESELNEVFSQVHGTPAAPMAPSPSKGVTPGKVWDSLKIPEQMSRQGYQDMQDLIPADVQTPTNIPGFGMMNAKQATGVLKTIAPPFVSRESILTAGVLPLLKAGAPFIKGAGTLVADGAEALSGLEHKTPGVLTDAAKSAGVLFGKGSAAAEPLYEAAKATLPREENIFNGIAKPEKVYAKALSYIKDGGKLEPIEAFTARKAASKMIRTGKFMEDELVPFIKKMDSIAKGDANLAAADAAHSAGLKSEAIRSLLPLNKTGGASTFKTMVLGSLKGLKTLGMASPIVQGTAATAIGGAARAAAPIVNNPRAAIGAISAAKSLPKVISEAKTLTEEMAMKFLRKAKGVPEIARQLAAAAGWEIPE